MIRLFVLLIMLLSAQPAAYASSVGFTQFRLDDPQRGMRVTLWYPSAQGDSVTIIADNPAFIGTPVFVDATPLPKRAPMILLSHGYRGNWKNLNWLANKLAKHGFFVAAVEHPGTTTRNTSPDQAAQWWQRPQDLKRVLDYVSTHQQWGKAVDSEQVTAIGHSLGGWTVMQLVGAKIDHSSFTQYCKAHPNPRTCGLVEELGLSHPMPASMENVSAADHRVKRVITLDLGMSRSFSIPSLNRVTIPTLILSAGIDIGNLAQMTESGYLAEHLPITSTRYRVYEQAAHFSFMQLCKANAKTLLEQENAGDGIVCLDGNNTSRHALHAKFFEDILEFIRHTD